MEIEEVIRQNYSAIRYSVAPDLPITVLHIGEDQTAVACGTGDEPSSILFLEIGSRRTGVDYFIHNPPTSGEVENAINVVEDEVTRARKITADNPTLFTTDATIHGIALLAGVSDQQQIELSRETVERTFDRFAAVVSGRPSSLEGIPSDAAFSATLLILREFLHHLGFFAIRVKM